MEDAEFMPDLDWRCCVEWRWNRDRGGGSGERAGTGNLMRLKIPNAGSSEAVATEHVQGGVRTIRRHTPSSLCADGEDKAGRGEEVDRVQGGRQQ